VILDEAFEIINFEKLVFFFTANFFPQSFRFVQAASFLYIFTLNVQCFSHFYPPFVLVMINYNPLPALASGLGFVHYGNVHYRDSGFEGVHRR